MSYTIYHPVCANFNCNNPVRMLKSGKFGMHCSDNCKNIHNSMKSNTKRKETWANKTKEETEFATEKRKITCKETYGVEFISQTDKCREINSNPSVLLRAQRSESLRDLNLNNKEFRDARQKSCEEFWNSERSNEIRNASAARAKIQHQNGQADHVRLYYRERYNGSAAQKAASIRATLNNPGNAPGAREKMRETYIKNSELGLHNKETKFKKKKFEDTNLIYQSSYELDFLELCKTNNILHRIKNAPCLSADFYPYNFYAPDYILDGTYIIEIKSWYIENLQEKKCPGLIKLKEHLVIAKGYKFLYIKDKDYTPFLSFIS